LAQELKNIMLWNNRENKLLYIIIVKKLYVLII
jgi:hypothetical protein